MENEIKELLDEIREIRIDINFIKNNMIERDAILTSREAERLDESIEEFREGKTTSLEDFEKEGE